MTADLQASEEAVTEEAPRQTASWNDFQPGRDRLKRQLLLLALAAIPALFIVAIYLLETWRIPAFRYVPFLLLFSLVILIWRYRPVGMVPISAWGRLWRGAAIVGGAGVLVLAAVFFSPWLFWCGLLLVALPISGQFRARTDLRPAFGPWALLILTLRPPEVIAERCSLWLQTAATQTASILLNVLGVLHLRSGNALHLPTRSFFTEEICGGPVSVFTLVAIAGAISLYYSRTLFQAVLLMLTAVGWAWVMHVARLLTIAGGFHYFAWEWSSAWSIATVSASALLLAALLLLSTDRLLLVFTGPIYGHSMEEYPMSGLNPLVLFYNRFFGGSPRPWGKWSAVFAPSLGRLGQVSYVAVLVVAVALFASGAIAAVRSFQVEGTGIGEVEVKETATLRPDSVAGSIGSWQRTGFAPAVEQQTRGLVSLARWTFRAERDEAVVRSDRIFDAAWQLGALEPYRGWEETERRWVFAEGFEDWPALAVQFEKPDGSHVLLLLNLFDRSGGYLTIEPPVEALFSHGLRSLVKGDATGTRFLVRTQLNSPDVITEERAEQVERLHLSVRHDIADELTASQSGEEDGRR